MDVNTLTRLYNRFKYRENASHSLMQKQVKDVLMVSTFYDAYIFEQDGGLSENIFGDYRELHLTTPPRVYSVPTGEGALKAIEERRFDLVITMMRIGELSPFELAKKIKERRPNLPVLLLLNTPSDLPMVEGQRQQLECIDNVFIWSGDSTLFVAMIKSIEDRKNLSFDTKKGLVRVILLVEDSIPRYSAFLPLLYSEIVKQTHRLISEEVTEANRRMRMRLRPKVIMVHDLESALHVYEAYKESLLCVISDVEFPANGVLTADAGVKLIRLVRAENPSMPLLLQSADDEKKELASDLNAHFINKNSEHLLREVREFIISQLGFGDFVFRGPGGNEVARASSMLEFISLLYMIPDESLVYHANLDQFSAWLIAHGEVEYAKKIKPVMPSDFEEVEELRAFLIRMFDEVKSVKNRGRIVDFTNWQQVSREQVVRLSDGSLGGKGRGVAFINALLHTLDIQKRFPDVCITVPITAIVGTGEFDRFIEANDIDSDIVTLSDEEIRKRFLKGELSDDLKERLAAYIEKVDFPLAVRSSGLLEDSQARPFAGVYRTIMLSNCNTDTFVRLGELMAAIKLVFASVFEQSAREYIESVHYKVEEEKMAVIIQEVIGTLHDNFYYPEISGVAQSYNYYPTGSLEHQDGIASVAFGLGRTVVEGKRAFRFCPRCPKTEILQPSELLGNTQKQFYALNMDCEDYAFLEHEHATLTPMRIRKAQPHGTLQWVTSVWDYENDRLVDHVQRPGPKIVTFSPILKYERFPLAALLDQLLTIGEQAMGVPVEIEFAVTLGDDLEHNRPTFALLQIRPLTVDDRDIRVEMSGSQEESNAVVYSNQALGNGLYHGITDFLFIDDEHFDRTQTVKIQQEIRAINQQQRSEGRKYVLIGPGRWGSRDRFLGVPVRWPDISEAQTIVEADLPGFRIDASQGTHFLHNVIAMSVGYVKVKHGSEDGWVDWDWLRAQEVIHDSPHCTLVRSAEPCTIALDAKRSLGAIFKPEPTESTQGDSHD